jgi:hypothetical protein
MPISRSSRSLPQLSLSSSHPSSTATIAYCNHQSINTFPQDRSIAATSTVSLVSYILSQSTNLKASVLSSWRRNIPPAVTLMPAKVPCQPYYHRNRFEAPNAALLPVQRESRDFVTLCGNEHPVPSAAYISLVILKPSLGSIFICTSSPHPQDEILAVANKP